MTDREQRREQLERDILAAIIARPEALASVRNAVRPEHFRHYKRIVGEILAAFEQGLKFDFATIAVAGKLSSSELAELCGIQPSFSANLPVLLRALAEEVIRDEAMNLKAAINPERDAFELIDAVAEFQRNAEGIITANTRPDKVSILNAYVEHCLKREEGERIPVPFPTLGKMLHGGFAPGGFTLLGGTPGSGKTSFMLALALHAAQSGTRVAFIEGEMTAQEVLERLNGAFTGEDIASVGRPENYGRLIKPFVSKFFDLPFELVPLYDRTLERLTSEVVAQVHRGARILFADYLQVFPPTRDRHADEFTEIRETSRRLRTLALQHGVHLFVASSLNRSEVRMDKLSLNSFYGSSGLGHDCSVGLILSSEQSDLQELVSPERNVTLHVVKNRSGPRGDITLKFHLRSQRFVELTQEEATERDNVFEDKNNGEQTF